MLSPAVALKCFGPPSPKRIIIYENTLKVIKLSDPCRVKFLNITVIFDGKTFVKALKYNAKAVNANIILPHTTPLTVTLAYSNYGGKTGSLKWTFKYLPYTTYTLVKLTSTVSKGTLRFFVIVNPPPEKPLLPKLYGDPSIPAGILSLAIIVAAVVGLVKSVLGKD